MSNIYCSMGKFTLQSQNRDNPMPEVCQNVKRGCNCKERELQPLVYYLTISYGFYRKHLILKLNQVLWYLLLKKLYFLLSVMNILVREYRCSGGTDTANPAPGNRCSRTEIPHLIVCYLRVYSLKAGSNPYTSRIDL